MLENLLEDLALLNDRLAGQVDVDVLTRPGRAGHVEARQVAALTAPPAGVGSGQGDRHTPNPRTSGPDRPAPGIRGSPMAAASRENTKTWCLPGLVMTPVMPRRVMAAPAERGCLRLT